MHLHRHSQVYKTSLDLNSWYTLKTNTIVYLHLATTMYTTYHAEADSKPNTNVLGYLIHEHYKFTTHAGTRLGIFWMISVVKSKYKIKHAECYISIEYHGYME